MSRRGKYILNIIICFWIRSELFREWPEKALKKIIYLFLERGERREKGGEKHRCVRETLIGCFSHAPNRGPGLPPGQVS